MDAELAYLFRHALLRDAAYDLQLPGDRARLHELAFYLIEEAFGGRAPRSTEYQADGKSIEAHPTDSVAEELAHHAGAALATRHGSDDLREARGCYLLRAGLLASTQHRMKDAAKHFEAHSREFPGPESAISLAGAGRAYNLLNDAPRSEHRLRQALRLFRESGDKIAQGRVQTSLATLLMMNGRIRQAEKIYQRSIRILKSVGDSHGVLLAQGMLALHFRRVGRVVESERLFLNAMELAERDSGGLVISSLQLNYGELLRQTGRLTEARVYLKQALESSIERHLVLREAEARATVGMLLADELKFDDAIAELRRAIATFVSAGCLGHAGVTTCNLANQLQKLGRHSEALAAYAEASSLCRESANDLGEALVLSNLGNLYVGTGELDRAEETLRRAIAAHRKISNLRSEGIAAGNLGEVFQRRGSYGEAIKHFDIAISIGQNTRNLRSTGINQCRKAVALLALGDRAQAVKAWDAGVSSMHSGNMSVEDTSIYEEMLTLCRDLRCESLHSDSRSSGDE